MRISQYLKITLLLIIFFFVSEIIIIMLGYGKAAFFLVFPIFYSNNPISLIPLIFILLLFLLPFFIFSQQSELHSDEQITSGSYEPFQNEEKASEQRSTSYGGFLLIGPIPIVFGKNLDKRIFYIMIILTLAVILIYLLLFLNL